MHRPTPAKWLIQEGLLLCALDKPVVDPSLFGPIQVGSGRWYFYNFIIYLFDKIITIFVVATGTKNANPDVLNKKRL
jgi:hypothetical protein